MVPILYQDNSIVVCVKPAGILSQPAPNCPESILSILAQQFGGEIYPIHRLDRGVGGVMVFARTQKAAAALSTAVQQQKLEKEYLCIVRGCPAEAEGVYKDLLFKDSSRNKTFVVDRMRKGVKEASLEYRTLDTKENASLVWVKLHTGRTHQIRVQFSSRKTPLLGDGKYGGTPGDIALWSFRLTFPHPVTKKVSTYRQLPEGSVWQKFDLPDL